MDWGQRTSSCVLVEILLRGSVTQIWRKFPRDGGSALWPSERLHSEDGSWYKSSCIKAIQLNAVEATYGYPLLDLQPPSHDINGNSVAVSKRGTSMQIYPDAPVYAKAVMVVSTLLIRM